MSNNAETIKFVGKFSTDCISLAMENVFQAATPTEQKHFENILSKVFKALNGSNNPKKPKIQMGVPSSKKVFLDMILPQIRTKIQQFEDDIDNGKIKAWNIEAFSCFPTDFTKMSIDELKAIHSVIIVNEGVLVKLELLFRFYRGMIYLHAYNLHNPTKIAGSAANWFKEEFDISYDAALKIMVFSLLIQRFPRLLVCDLTYNQLRKHNTNIKKYLSTDEGSELNAKLAQRLDIYTPRRDWGMVIESSEVFIPDIPFKSEDPDHHYYESNLTSNSAGASSFAQWMDQNPDQLQCPKDSNHEMVKEINQAMGQTILSDDSDEDAS